MTKRLLAVLALIAAIAACTPGASPLPTLPSPSVDLGSPSIDLESPSMGDLESPSPSAS